MFFETELTNKERILLLIDFNNILHRAFHAYDNLSFSGKSTACLYGVIITLAKTIPIFNPNYIIVCDDFPPYLRRQLLPEFKNDRPKADPERVNEFNESKADCEKFLDLLNIPIVKSEGLEADDIIASFVRDHHNDSFDKIVIMSNDDDLFQLLTYPKVVLQRSKNLYDLKAFKEEYPDMKIEDWAKFTALAGSHNNVPHLAGIGKVKGAKILISGKWDEVYAQHKEELDLYLKLIRLPLFDTFRSPFPPWKKSHFDERLVMNYFRFFGITMTQSMCNSFELLN